MAPAIGRASNRAHLNSPGRTPAKMSHFVPSWMAWPRSRTSDGVKASRAIPPSGFSRSGTNSRHRSNGTPLKATKVPGHCWTTCRRPMDPSLVCHVLPTCGPHPASHRVPCRRPFARNAPNVLDRYVGSVPTRRGNSDTTSTPCWSRWRHTGTTRNESISGRASAPVAADLVRYRTITRSKASRAPPLTRAGSARGRPRPGPWSSPRCCRRSTSPSQRVRR